MRHRVFDDTESCLLALEGILTEFIISTARVVQPRCAILAGGSTPLPAYRALAVQGLMASENLFFALSDERMVSPDHPDSNYGQMLPMFDALGLSPDQILNIDAELTLTESAKSYHDKWAAFFAEGGKISLSVLGLGPDGHTASLFSFHDASPQSMWAIPVQRDPGPNRVSVTRDLLGRAERTVLICPGDSKHEIVKRVLNDPNSVIAAHALCDCPDVEIWTT